MKIIRTLLISCMTLLVATSAFSQEPVPNAAEQESVRQHAEWTDAEKKMYLINSSDLTLEEKCQRRWDIQWPLAKSGNLDARYNLYISLSKNWIRILGRPHDKITNMRDHYALFFNSFGSSNLANEYRNQSPERVFSYFAEYLPPLANNEELKNCMSYALSRECAYIAIESGIILSFEEYAADVDLYLRNGSSIQCEGSNLE